MKKIVIYSLVFAMLKAGEATGGYDCGPDSDEAAARMPWVFAKFWDVAEDEATDAGNELYDSATTGGMEPSAHVQDLNLGTLTPIAGVYADLAAARTSVNTLATEVGDRVSSIQQKINQLFAAMKAANLME